MADLILREWDGKRIRIRADRYVCLTDMAKASKKKFQDWFRLESAKSYLSALSAKAGIPALDLVQVTKGGAYPGTWGHPKVALRFAQWCSEEFAVQIDEWIDELLTTGTVSIASAPKVFSLDMAVRRDPMDWEQMFMASWITEAERLTKWKWTWKVMSSFINSTVYAYLPVDIATLLRSLRDSHDKTLKLHQFLQPEIRSIVFDHLNTVEDLMRAAKGNMSLFELLMSNYFGRYKLIESDNDQLSLFEVETKYLPISTS